MERYGHVARSFNRLVDGLASTRCVHSVCVCVCVCDKRSGNDVTGRRNTSCSLRSISSGLKEKKSVARRWSPSRLSVCPRARAIPLPHAALFFFHLHVLIDGSDQRDGFKCFQDSPALGYTFLQ